jgi:hypothetical protein
MDTHTVTTVKSVVTQHLYIEMILGDQVMDWELTLGPLDPSPAFHDASIGYDLRMLHQTRAGWHLNPPHAAHARKLPWKPRHGGVEDIIKYAVESSPR